MRAMILAAGFGSRLKPITEKTPKALVEIGKKPLLGMLLEKLHLHRFERVVVNVHHHAGQIDEYVKSSVYPEGWIRLSEEKRLLGTGGGVRNAAPLLDDGDPLLVHNVDVLSNLPFRKLYNDHEENGAKVTLVVKDRPTERALAVDEDGNLCGRWGSPPVRSPRGKLSPVGFNGIQLLSPGVASELAGEGEFSLVDSYLEMASRREAVRVFSLDAWYWADVGTRERLDRLERDLKVKRIPIESLYM